MPKDLIADYCKGQSRFPSWCGDFDVFTQECDLLKASSLQAIFERGRCQPDEMVKAAARGRLAQFADRLPRDVRLEYENVLPFELSEKIKAQQLKKGYSLPILKGYINKTAYFEIPRALAKDGYLGEDDEAMDDVNQIPQPETPVMPLTGLLSQIAELLAERARNEKKLKRKQICVRQHGMYLRIIALLEADADANRAKQLIADEFGINRKMLQRDLDEIEEFLTQENVLPRRRTDSLQGKNDAK